MIKKPNKKTNRPLFSSGPCAKHPNWSITNLDISALGRSHRAKKPKELIELSINLTSEILEVPADYKVAIVPASDTGAFELAMWNVLGHVGIDILAWESFGKGWVTDIISQLKLTDINKLEADYGSLPDLLSVNMDRDIVFTLNGTTSGVKVPNLDWISDHRKGLTLCDATSGLFAQRVDWKKLDITTFSWQKVLGGEAQHGIIILSPRAIERLNTYSPPWPLPKIFRIKKAGQVDESIFTGSTINTPSLLCVSDYVDALKWARDIGGLNKLISIADNNLEIIKEWVNENEWVSFLAKDKDTLSNTSVCLQLSLSDQITHDIDISHLSKLIQKKLEEEGVGYDLGSYRDAPPGLRIWTGATIDSEDIKILLSWIEWAYFSILEDQ
ncbi:MAG: phosphoserine transaminase [Alphaproteobacteria bacterium]|uniref:phosphoserine transaminase n=1 Tax=PS1 clade bacterium TaxID=2175152 RepID=A0A368DQ02_9PROT|nr:phosphoserine transaminase [Rhodobiaceae bacterium]OUT75393.1 MAG: phosphoserine aminotransferase [Rhizobiales bacterium TMED25]RCL73928.1 MAG: phosphoserine transaminase [PS1 clade bacterium]|tara:strand:+ start:16333 stop:17487 length:1155 start_codon:yes stop_codon:yes gene_type:complete